MLSCAQKSVSDSTIQLPSWVPNWAADHWHERHSLLWEGFDTAANTSLRISYFEPAQILTVRGLIFDTVSDVAELPYHRKHEGIVPATEATLIEQSFYQRSLFDIFDRISQVAQPYPGDQSFEDAYSRVFICDSALEEEGTPSSQNQLCRAGYDVFRRILAQLEDLLNGDFIGLTDQDYDLALRYENAQARVISKKFCATSKRYLGWLVEAGAVGDVVCIFSGCTVPFLLRPDGDDHYILIGECYIQGIMYGEALAKDDLIEQDFRIR